jgi:hypothetical protein
LPSSGDRNASLWKSVGPAWWEHLDRITIVAAASREELPSLKEVIACLKRMRLEPGLRWVSQTPRTSISPFVPNAIDEQVAEMESEMLTGLWWRGAAWAAYWGDATEIDRLGRVESSLSALYARIRAKVKFETRNAEGMSDVRRTAELSAKRGPKPNMERHRAIADVMKPYGSKWAEPSNLEAIAKVLAKNNIPPVEKWAKRSPPIRSWPRAVQFHPELVRKALAYSLKVAAKDPAAKPSETLGNPR